MSLIKADGTIVKLANLTDVTDTASTVEYVVLTEDLYTTKTLPGASKFEGGKFLAYNSGQIVPLTELQNLYTTATVTTVSPATGGIAGGTEVTITGTDLAGTTGVTFGGSTATSVVVVSDTKITCVTPAHSSGAVNVVVQDDAGNVTKTNAFTYA